MKGHVRTLVYCLEARLGAKIPPDHPLLTWIVQFASTSYYKYSIGHDGKTAEQRMIGRRTHQHTAEFAEKVMWMPLNPGAKVPAMQPWAHGCRLCYNAVISACDRGNQLCKAMELPQEMQQSGL